MPLILMTGYPSSGKTTRCREIKKYLEDNFCKRVHVISEESFYQESNTDKNKIAFDSKKQKEIRSIMKVHVTRAMKVFQIIPYDCMSSLTECVTLFVRLLTQKLNGYRLLGSDIVILDASNNIKGYRYELYCASKCHSTTQCVIFCDVTNSKAWELNEVRETEDQYTREAFDALVSLMEPVNDNNRWDKPLIRFRFDEVFSGKDIYDALYNEVAPKSNQSTQNIPICPSTYLSNLDKVTKDVINAILQLQNDGVCGRNVKLPIIDTELTVLDDRLNARKLTNLKQQFISYCKRNPPNDSQSNVAKLFVQFINSSS